MTIDSLRQLFTLRHLLTSTDCDDVDDFIAKEAALVAWCHKERGQPHSTNDRILDLLHPIDTMHMTLLVYLATIDKTFFMLARRMAARTLVRNVSVPLEPLQRHMIAHLLGSEVSSSRLPMAARDVVLIITVAVAAAAGCQPFENSARQGTANPRGACRRISDVLSSKYGVQLETSAIEKVWRNRKARLVAAKFSEEDVTDFLDAISPTKG